MAELKGTFYGVSVGPGDPELLTLQAVRLIRKCPVLAAPQTSSGQMLALDIARSALGKALDGKTIVPLHFAMSRDPAVLAASHKAAVQAVRLIRKCPVLAAPQTSSGQMLALDIARSALGKALDGKTIVPLHFAMSRDPAVLAASHKAAVQAVRPYLDAGQDTAMLNLGDVSIYATFGYLQCLLEAEGYPTAMAAGVPSFCAAAARLNVPLTGGMDAPLTIAPGSWAGRVLETPGTKVLMKTGRQLPALLDTLRQADKLKNSALVCNCGLPDEQVCPDLSCGQPQIQPGYFTTVLVKE